MPERLTIREIKKLVPTLYTDEFFAGLARRFDFPPLAPATAETFWAIARGYLVAQSEEPLRERAGDYYREFNARMRTTKKFVAALKQAQEDDVAFQMFKMAFRYRPPNDKFDIADLPEARMDSRNNRHYEHLLGLSNLFAAVVQHELDEFKLPPGRRKNDGLQGLVDYADMFWSDTLGRKFSIDYHQGSHLSPAFEFVEALVKPLDTNLTETQIITAMRARIKSRNKEKEKRRQPSLPKPANDAHKN